MFLYNDAEPASEISYWQMVNTLYNIFFKSLQNCSIIPSLIYIIETALLKLIRCSYMTGAM